MGTPLMGRNASVKIGTYTILNLGSWTMPITSDEIDGSAFGTTWGAVFLGLNHWNATVEGFYDMSDTTGQLVLKNAKISATLITNIRFYLDANSFITPSNTADSNAGCYIKNMNIKQDKSGLGAVTYDIVGAGALAWV